MGSRKVITLLAAVVILLAAVIIHLSPWVKRPFSGLEAGRIASVTVFAIPPNRTVLVEDGGQIQQIADILKTIEVYQKDGGVGDRGGQLVRFTLNMESGEVIEVEAFNPYLSIDGQYYRTKYEPCEQLNSLGNRLLDTGF